MRLGRRLLRVLNPHRAFPECRQPMLVISPSIRIPLSEISLAYIRSSGPGGQHVNKTSTAVQLRFNIGDSASLSDDIKLRLARLAGSRLTQGGDLIIEARRFRSQEANRRDALDRLSTLIARAERPPRARRATTVPRAELRRRLTGKRIRSRVKKLRTRVVMEE